VLRGVELKARSMDGKAMLVPVTLTEVSMKAAATEARASQVLRGTASSAARRSATGVADPWPSRAGLTNVGFAS
jgi:hypothetical protein